MTRQTRAARSLMLAFAMLASNAALADDTVLRKFESGSGSNTVGIVDPSEDVELAGPDALTSDELGNLFILDQINGRILRFDPKLSTVEPDLLKLPDDVQPTDLVVRKDDILVWDGTIRTLKASDGQSTRDISGGSTIRLEESSDRGVDDRFASSAFAQMGSQQPGSASDLLDENTRAVVTTKARQISRQYIASRGKGSVVADIMPDKKPNAVRIEVHKAETNETIARLNLRVQGRLGAVEFLEIDYSNRLYVLAEDIPNSVEGAATFVARYAASGKLEGIYELPLTNTPLTRRFVTVSGDGDVYFLRTRTSDIEVVGVGFRPLRDNAMIDVHPPAPPNPLTAFFDSFKAIAAVRPSNRQQVIETAFAFEGLQWKLTPANYGSDPDTPCSGFNRIRRPWYLQGKVNQEVRGVPYCWGCHGSLANFRFQMDRGVKAGNVCTQNAPRPDVAGVDCSAFVSAAWGLSVHYTTAAIPAIAKRLDNPWDLKPGDALDKPGSHVMLFLRFTPDRKAEVMESSTGGCNGRVCRNIYPLAALLSRGYVPVRYRALADDRTAVSANAYLENNTPSTQPKSAQPKKARKK
jgi:hypothetical protein